MSERGHIIGRGTWLLRQIGKRVWVRAVAFSLFAVATAVLSALVSPYIDLGLSLTVAGKAVSDLLDILATSMLAVTSFSLSIMVNAYAAASQNTTPRATQLLITDSLAANTLSTFVGSFLFAIVGIVGLSAGLYNEQGRVILLIATVLVLLTVTAALLRWIDELGYFGRVGSTLQRVEDEAVESARNWGRLPRLGGAPLTDVPPGATPLLPRSAGHIQFIDTNGLQEIASARDTIVHLTRRPGAFVSPAEPMGYIECELTDQETEKLHACFKVEVARDFQQDPHYGLAVLSEIASKALSPAINDPGTAIRAVQGGLRALLAFAEGRGEANEVLFDRLRVADLEPQELVDEFINPIARDGREVVEVQIAIQKALSILAESATPLLGEAARRVARDARDRAAGADYTPRERERLDEKTRWVDAAE